MTSARMTAHRFWRLVLAAILCLGLQPAPAGAQALSWWLGSGGGGPPPPENTAGDGEAALAWWLGRGPQAPAEEAGENAGGRPTAWWLGTGEAGPQPIPVQAEAPAAVPAVSWWLGTAQAQEAAPAPQANQTLNWWLGGTAEADDGAPATTEKPPANEPPDYERWATVRLVAEESVGDPEVPNFTLEQLRAEIVKWRERFLTAQSANKARIETLKSQLNALGPVPEGEAAEAPEIAARRAELNDQLTKLQAPGLTAEEAYLAADGLISEIDSILRERQASELLTLGPSPLVPLNWPPAIGALIRVGQELWTEGSQALGNPNLRSDAWENLPVTLLLVVLGLALLTRGRRWAERITQRFLTGAGRRSRRVVLSLLVSLAQVLVPFAGVVILVSATYSTGMLGPRGLSLARAIPMIGFVVLAARWLGQRVFAGEDDLSLLPGLAPERRAEGRFYATLLGLLLALAGLLAATILYGGETAVPRVVLEFPVLLLGGLILLRLGQILVGAARANQDGAEGSTRGRLLVLIGRAAILCGFVGPALAAVGYYTAGRFFVFPAALSLALLAFLIILQRLTGALYALATHRKEDEEEALVPVLIGFALGLGALPVLALIWGARVSDLTELWARAREGFTVGETRIAPTDFLTFVAVFAVGYLATRLVQGALKTSVLPKTRIDPGGQNALVSGVGYLGIFLAAVVAVTWAGIDLSSLAIVAGALSVGIGFGLQNIVSNFISGIILLVERPISEGDWIEVNGQQGHVRDISVRSTRIETFDRTDVIVPNSDLISGVVTNYTRGNLTGRIILKVGVAYGTDTKRVEAILREIVEDHPLVSLNPKPGILFVGFGADSLDFEVRAILRDVNFSMSTKSDLNHEIARRFAEEAIEIPFAQRDIWLRNPEALTGPARAEPKKKGRKKVRPSDPVDPMLQDPPGAEEDDT